MERKNCQQRNWKQTSRAEHNNIFWIVLTNLSLNNFKVLFNCMMLNTIDNSNCIENICFETNVFSILNRWCICSTPPLTCIQDPLSKFLLLNQCQIKAEPSIKKHILNSTQKTNQLSFVRLAYFNCIFFNLLLLLNNSNNKYQVYQSRGLNHKSLNHKYSPRKYHNTNMSYVKYFHHCCNCGKYFRESSFQFILVFYHLSALLT